MKKGVVKFLGILIILFGTICALSINQVCFANADNTIDIKISNRLFSLGLPHKFKGLYLVKKGRSRIYIYDKKSKKAGFGGYAFGIGAFKIPSEYAMSPGSQKIGELVDKKGILYDIVLSLPTDVQYDYVTGNADSYYQLYNYAQNIGKNISGVNGSKYYNKQGTLGKDLYKEVLKRHLTALQEKWDSSKLENENMSYMYNVVAAAGKDVYKTIGYIYSDINGDGIEELLIGEIAKGEWKGIIYDIYTMVNRKPVHVISGGSRNRYFICDGNYFICNEYSSGAFESGLRTYVLIENSDELFPQVTFKYDEYEDKNNPWFISYTDEKFEPVSESYYKERMAPFSEYERFDYIPFSSLIK